MSLQRQFIIEVKAAYRVDPHWNILRILATEDRWVGPGTNTERVYTCLAQERDVPPDEKMKA